MQTILGAGGAIGKELAKALAEYTKSIRLVSRNPRKVNETDELFPADLTKKENVFKAVEGSEVVYLTAGFSYNINVWRNTWPSVMRNVIDACKSFNARLVFFDNIYMYDPAHMDHITEETPVNPSSKKGKVRAEIAGMLLDETKKGSLKALIARSADFYGPSIQNTSVLTETVFKNLASGKKANWFVSLKYKHSYTYTPDAGKAVAILGNTDDAYNQVWHLPTAGNPMNGKEWIEAIARELLVKPRVMIASRFMIRMLGLFNPIMREFVEMLYQYDRDYVFISKKFEERFQFLPTSYEEGIKTIVKTNYKG